MSFLAVRAGLTQYEGSQPLMDAVLCFSDQCAGQASVLGVINPLCPLPVPQTVTVFNTSGRAKGSGGTAVADSP